MKEWTVRNLECLDLMLPDNILRLKENDNQNIQILEETIHQMKADGHAYRKLKIRASVALRDEVFQPGMKVKVHIPIPALGHQIIATRILDHSPSMKSIDEESSVFRAICFEETMTENHEYYVVYEYETDITYVDLYQEAERCVKNDCCKERSYPADLEQYTTEKSLYFSEEPEKYKLFICINIKLY